jgi:hypothetical protein
LCLWRCLIVLIWMRPACWSDVRIGRKHTPPKIWKRWSRTGSRRPMALKEAVSPPSPSQAQGGDPEKVEELSPPSPSQAQGRDPEKGEESPPSPSQAQRGDPKKVEELSPLSPPQILDTNQAKEGLASLSQASIRRIWRKSFGRRAFGRFFFGRSVFAALAAVVPGPDTGEEGRDSFPGVQNLNDLLRQ